MNLGKYVCYTSQLHMEKRDFLGTYRLLFSTRRRRSRRRKSINSSSYSRWGAINLCTLHPLRGDMGSQSLFRFIPWATHWTCVSLSSLSSKVSPVRRSTAAVLLKWHHKRSCTTAQMKWTSNWHVLFFFSSSANNNLNRFSLLWRSVVPEFDTRTNCPRSKFHLLSWGPVLSLSYAC